MNNFESLLERTAVKQRRRKGAATPKKKRGPSRKDVEDLQTLLMEISNMGLEMNTNPRNKRITLDADDAKALATKQRRLLKKMLAISSTTVGAAIVAVMMRKNPQYTKALKDVIMETVRLIPSAKNYIVAMASKIASRVPGFGTQFKTVVRPAVATPTTKSRLRVAAELAGKMMYWVPGHLYPFILFTGPLDIARAGYKYATRK